MADANICDRCGVIYEKRWVNIQGIHAKDIRITSGTEYYYEGKKYDICPKCLESFKQWLKGEENGR